MNTTIRFGLGLLVVTASSIGVRIAAVSLAFGAFLSFSALVVRAEVWQPSPGHSQLPLWSGAKSGPRPAEGSEEAAARTEDHLVAGKPWTYVEHVSTPTITLYSPEGKNTGAAVVVFPGGGYNILAIDLEGTEVCDWLTAKGIACVLLKYRVPCAKVGPYRNCSTARRSARRRTRPTGKAAVRISRWFSTPVTWRFRKSDSR